ncbi:MAG: recombinase family protein [Candidatus Kerfeldbacteria bacterium]|nr:recombinase family protein [Candidatus Kerfeldbacteria bacterium]
MDKAVCYIRVSTKEQARPGRLSLGTQKQICEDLAKRSELQIIKVFEDAGRSATKINRAALQEMLSFINDNPEVKTVIVQDTDRLARNTQDHLTIMALLRKQGVQLMSASQPGIDDTPEGNLLDTILAAVNQLQSDQNGRKVRNNMKRKAQEGWWPTQAPLGYLNVKNEFEKNIIKTDPQGSKYIKQAFKLFSTGNYSVRELGDVLYQNGFRNHQNRSVGKNAINSILKNKFYLGKLIWKQEEHKGQHEALIDEQTFDKVQRILYLHGGKDNRRRKHTFLLRGFIYCVCGARMTAEHHPKKNKSYYRCPKGKACDEPFIQVNDLEDEAANLFKNLHFSDKLQQTLVGRLQTIFEKRKGVIDKERQTIINQRVAVEQKRNVAEDKLLKDVISDEDFGRIRKTVVDELEALNKELKRLDAERNFEIDPIRVVLEFTRDIHSAYIKAPERLKRRYLNLFWDRLVVQNKSIVSVEPTKVVKALLDANALVTKEPALKPVLITVRQQG